MFGVPQISSLPRNTENTAPIQHMRNAITNEVLSTTRKSSYVSGEILSAEPIITDIHNIATPMLTIMPVCLVTEVMADASPVSVGGTDDMRMDVFGAVNIANPKPTRIIVAMTMSTDSVVE